MPFSVPRLRSDVLRPAGERVLPAACPAKDIRPVRGASLGRPVMRGPGSDPRDRALDDLPVAPTGLSARPRLRRGGRPDPGAGRDAVRRDLGSSGGPIEVPWVFNRLEVGSRYWAASVVEVRNRKSTRDFVLQARQACYELPKPLLITSDPLRTGSSRLNRPDDERDDDYRCDDGGAHGV